MKFDHLIKHYMRNIFLEKSYAKYGRESLDQSFKVLNCFFPIWQAVDYRNILNLSCILSAFTSFKTFSKKLSTWSKNHDKYLSWERKEFLRWNKKLFFEVDSPALNRILLLFSLKKHLFWLIDNSTNKRLLKATRLKHVTQKSLDFIDRSPSI